ncbi:MULTISPECIES: hypothetical protein [Glutamicibacter]|uniref:hypothetical protein n=1 Tax=Glutamicibacter TaxID=1742989 RepID=UPI003FD03642
MNPLVFLAAVGAMLATFILGFTSAGFQVAGSGNRKEFVSSRGGTVLVLLLITVGCSLVLVKSVFINPLWVRYAVLFGLPVVSGYIIGRLVPQPMDEHQSGDPGN